ncbi:MAG: hypothetical protein WAV47_12260 [Blastocatellia bacterium]
MMKDKPQLQAADIVAYEVNKRAANIFGLDENKLRASLNNLELTAPNFRGMYYGKIEISRIIKTISGEELFRTWRP